MIDTLIKHINQIIRIINYLIEIHRFHALWKKLIKNFF